MNQQEMQKFTWEWILAVPELNEISQNINLNKREYIDLVNSQDTGLIN